MARERQPHTVLMKPSRAQPDSPRIVPVLRPKLPTAAELLPYLTEIDEHRWYSNGGPIVARLEEQLSRHIGFFDRRVVTVANCTLGLTAALLARRLPAGSLCVIPSWTFAATPHAARAAGLKPWFLDVDRRTWALNPDQVSEAVRQMHQPVSAVIVVSPFGAPVDVRAWEDFEDRTGIAVIVDAAAGFDTARAARIPFVVSLHATKILGAGEGGFIASADAQFLERVRACCNFGFQGSRNAMLPAINAKLSEYHAAVALASLAAWPATRQAHGRIMAWYRQGVARLGRVALQPKYGRGWVSGTTSIVLPPGARDRVAQKLSEAGIETRPWWGTGCHTQPAFQDCPRGALPVTADLGGRVLGLPHFSDIARRDIDAVLNALSEALGHLASPGRRIA